MKIFFDTNVIIDLLAERKQWLLPTVEILDMAQHNKVDLFCSIISLPTANYIMESQTKIAHDIVIKKLECFISICEPIAADKNTAKNALNSSFKDFEDAMQYFSAIAAGCDVIITRNKKDFAESKIPIMTPQEFLEDFCEEGKNVDD